MILYSPNNDHCVQYPFVLYIACWPDAAAYVIHQRKATILPVESLGPIINANNL